jgi:hypothetical protein
MAKGQTLTNLDLTDVLPNDVQFVGVDATTFRGTYTATTAVSTPSATLPGSTLTRRFASVTGTTAANDATLPFTYYLPRKDAAGNPVVEARMGAPVTSVDDAKAQGNGPIPKKWR